MRAVVQRVSRASVSVDGTTVSEISDGLLVLLGVSVDDSEEDAKKLVDKVLKLRIFNDEDGKMNLSVGDIGGSLLVVSQFTLYGDARKGTRPSYIKAARPKEAKDLYEFFVSEARLVLAQVETGKFQAMMNVELVNDGPVTILLDSKKQF